MKNEEIKQFSETVGNSFENDFDYLKFIYYSMDLLLFNLKFYNLIDATEEEKESFNKLEKIKNDVQKIIFENEKKEMQKDV